MGLSGLEPPTSPLSGVRSNQLSYRPLIKEYQPLLKWLKVQSTFKRVTRIELATTAWKAVVLPLNYTRNLLVDDPDRIWTGDLLRDREAC